MRGFVEHDGKTCNLGEHSNRGRVTYMCPVFLELRRTRIKNQMRFRRFADKTGLTSRPPEERL